MNGILPGIGTLTGGLTGGPATAQAGPATGGQTGAGISSPIVIGGYKTDGTASAVLPGWAAKAALLAGAGLFVFWLWRRSKK